MYMQIDETNCEEFKRAEEITGVDYEIKWIDAENNKGYIDNDGVSEMIRDLICEIDRLQEEMEDLKRFYEENYKPKSDRELYELWDGDF